MKLVSKKIYKAGLFMQGATAPTLEYKGTPKVYVSLATYQPKLEDMTEITADLKAGMNMLQGQIRWIAAEYLTPSDAVYECGIITSVKNTGEA